MSETQANPQSGNGKTVGGPQLNGNGASHDGSAMAALGELICRLNPYTKLPFDPTTNMQTGPMEVVTLPKPSNYTPDPANDTIACMAIEAERNYNTTWSFKGQTQNVKAAFRIPYRFQVCDSEGKVKYWQTEYLLIGYAGGDGGG
jgi:hypothetical protein